MKLPSNAKHGATVSIAVLLLCPAIGIGSLAAPGATGGSASAARVVDTMIARNAERAKELQSYQAMRTYSLQYRAFFRTYRARLVASVKYDASGTRRFTVVSQSGSDLLIHRVLDRLMQTEEKADEARNRKNVDLNRQNYNFSDLEWNSAPDGCSYSVTVSPRRADPLLYRGRIWINDRDFAVCRMQVQPSQRPSFWIKSTRITQIYHKVDRFWLPKRNESISKIRLGGTAKLTIENSDQKILAADPPRAD